MWKNCQKTCPTYLGIHRPKQGFFSYFAGLGTFCKMVPVQQVEKIDKTS